MNIYYGTFGIGHKLGEYIQPLIARNIVEAHNTMSNKYKADWCGIYSAEDYKNSKVLQNYKLLKPLMINEDKF